MNKKLLPKHLGALVKAGQIDANSQLTQKTYQEVNLFVQEIVKYIKNRN